MREMTKSFLLISFSSAAESETSREMGLACLRPSARALALARVRQALRRLDGVGK
jgi:hypothetical protein